MTDLIERIKAAIDEDERIVREVLNVSGDDRDQPTWTVETFVGDYANYCHVNTFGEEVGCGREGFGGEELAAHIARHDPDRVLRHVEATRKLLGQHLPNGDQDFPLCDECSGRTWPCSPIEALAAIYGIKQ